MNGSQYRESALERAIARREFLLRTLGTGASLGVLPALLAACGGSDGASEGSPAAKRGGTLRYGGQTDLLKLDPAFTDTELPAVHAIHEGLTAYKPGSLDVIEQLAQELEPSEDGLRVRFKLKPGIPFHDGFGEVTAEDVKYSFERIAGMTKPKIESYYVADWAPQLEQVKVQGKLEGTIVLNRPFAPLMATTLPGLAGLVVSKRAATERGERFARQPVGTGPYRVASFAPKRELVLQRFEDYGGASSQPFFDEIVISRTGDVNSVVVALSTDELDAVEFQSTELDRIEGARDLETKRITGVRFDWISMNVTDPALSDVKVRQAIRLAVDVPAILEAAYNGTSEQATAAVSPVMPIGHWKDAPRYERDVEAAKALLAEAGVSGLTLKLRANSEESQFVKAAELVQANLRDVGIDVKLVLQDSATFFATTGDALKQDQLAIVSFATLPDPFWVLQWFTCQQVGVYNMMSWCDAEYGRLLAESTKELDPERRAAICVRMQELWDENANAIWLTWPALAYGMRAGVVGSWRPDGEPQLHAFSRA